jgi:hypothetical protein
METIHVTGTTGPDGALNLRVPVGRPNTPCEVVIVVSPKTDDHGWPPGYFDLAGSITDETFVRHPQGELPKPISLE